MAEPTTRRVGLFVTCLVDLIRPSVGFAAAKLLHDAGCVVEVPPQTCCGQPAFNSGDRATTRDIARQVVAAFAPYDYVVVPSGNGRLKIISPQGEESFERAKWLVLETVCAGLQTPAVGDALQSPAPRAENWVRFPA